MHMLGVNNDLDRFGVWDTLLLKLHEDTPPLARNV